VDLPKKKESKKDIKKGARTPTKAAPSPKQDKERPTKAGKLAKLLAPSEAEYIKSREDTADKEDTLDIVSFYLNDTLFALEVEFIGAVIRSRKTVELPHMPDFIEGLISVRGEMILVMNLKRRLGIDSTSSGGNIIVSEQSSGGNETAILVDKMAGVLEVDSKFKVPLNGANGKKKTEIKNAQGYDFIKGTVESSTKGLIKVLDMQKLMAFDMPAGVT
jgi:purine-binding chemotaxis protein CheW